MIFHLISERVPEMSNLKIKWWFFHLISERVPEIILHKVIIYIIGLLSATRSEQADDA